MLNVELIENLYNGLDKEQKERLMDLVFKKSKQGITYFRRTNDIMLSSWRLSQISFTRFWIISAWDIRLKRRMSMATTTSGEM